MKCLFCDRCGKKQEVGKGDFPPERFRENAWRGRDFCASCLDELYKMQVRHDAEIARWFRK